MKQPELILFLLGILSLLVSIILLVFELTILNKIKKSLITKERLKDEESTLYLLKLLGVRSSSLEKLTKKSTEEQNQIKNRLKNLENKVKWIDKK